MLVLTRRENEKILLPDVGVTVELMSVSGNRARIGITAPDSVRILREEVAAEKEHLHGAIARGPVSREFVHSMRNRINSAVLAAEMLRLQLQAGSFEETDDTLGRVGVELKALTALLNDRSITEAPAPTRASRPWRALLVEDDANESKLLAGVLSMTGFDVVTADDGADALDYLRSHERPDFVLLDMLMPRCDGPTTISRIRRDPKLSGMKVYAVSGSSPMGLGVSTGPKGVDRWFEKPIDPKELVRHLNTELAAASACS